MPHPDEVLPPELHVGTSSWATDDWVGPFYPPGTRPGDYLAHYSTRFSTVEIDSTWYRAPSARLVDGWREKTPPGFLFSAKVPRTITHEKALVGCGEEMADFLTAMERLGEKLGPLLFQFEYVAKGKDAAEYASGAEFLSRLEPFLAALPQGHRYVVEVRNEGWLSPRLMDILRRNRVALALNDYFTMPPIDRFLEKSDPGTADFLYVRFLGHHRLMDARVRKAVEQGSREREWGALALDRTREMERWVPAIQELLRRRVPIFAYFNNHYAGYAPGSIDLFLQVWKHLRAKEPGA